MLTAGVFYMCVDLHVFCFVYYQVFLRIGVISVDIHLWMVYNLVIK